MAFYNSAYASLLEKRPYSSLVNQDFSSHPPNPRNPTPQFQHLHQKIPTVNQKVNHFELPVETEASYTIDVQRKKLKQEQEPSNHISNRDYLSRIVNPITQFNGSQHPEMTPQFGIPKDRGLESFSRGNLHPNFQGNNYASRHIFNDGCLQEENSMRNLHFQSQMKQMLNHQKVQSQNVNQNGLLRFPGVSPQSIGFFNSLENLTQTAYQDAISNARQTIETPFRPNISTEKNPFLTQRVPVQQGQLMNLSKNYHSKSGEKQDFFATVQTCRTYEISKNKSPLFINDCKDKQSKEGKEREKKEKAVLRKAKNEERMSNQQKNSTPDSIEEDKSTLISPASFQVQDTNKFDLFNDEFGPEMDVFKHLEEFPFLDQKEGLFDLSLESQCLQSGTMDSNKISKQFSNNLSKQNPSKIGDQTHVSGKKRGRPRKNISQNGPLQTEEKQSKDLVQGKSYSEEISEKTRVPTDNRDVHKQKPVLTKVGPMYQTWIPSHGERRLGTTRRSIKKVWSPDDASQDCIDSFVSNIQEAIGTKVDNFVSVLRVLKVYNMNSEHALEIIKRDPKYYQIYFKMSKKNSKLRFGH